MPEQRGRGIGKCRRNMDCMPYAETAKQRLLFLRRTSSFGGADVLILDLLKGIDYRANGVCLASSADYFSRFIRDSQLPVECVPITASFDGGFCRVLASWARYLRRLRPDKIVIAEGGFREFALAPALAAFAVARGNVWLMELHPAAEPREGDSITSRKLIPLNVRERARVRLTRGVLSVSHGVKDRLVRTYGYTPERVNVVHHGVDIKRFAPVSKEARRNVRSQFGIKDDAIVIVSTARLVPTKRIDRLIRAFGVLSAERKDLVLLLTGEGPERDELERLGVAVGGERRIQFLGNVPDVSRVLLSGNFYVLPSNEEGFGIALVEAMACELVCVATATVGPSEIIEDGVNGLLTEVSYGGVLEGMRRALAMGQAEAATLGRRAREKVIADFRVETAVAKGLEFMGIASETPLAR